MGKSKKGGLSLRRKNALARLEAAYESFKKEKKDKESFVSANGHRHPFRSYADECARMRNEIDRLKKLT